MSSRPVASPSPGTLPSSPLLRLPDELIALVASRFRADCTAEAADQALQSLASVSQRLYNIVNPILWQRISFSFCDERSPTSLDGLNRMVSHIADFELFITGDTTFIGYMVDQIAIKLVACRHLVTFGLSFRDSPSGRSYDIGQDDAKLIDRILVEPLMAIFHAIGPQLLTLTMDIDWNGPAISHAVPAILSSSPNLQKLVLNLAGLVPAHSSFPALPLHERHHLNSDTALLFPRLQHLESLLCPSFFRAFRPDPKTPLLVIALQQITADDLSGIQVFVDGRMQQTQQTLRKLIVKSDGFWEFEFISRSEDAKAARQNSLRLLRDCLKWARLHNIDVEADWYDENALGGGGGGDNGHDS